MPFSVNRNETQPLCTEVTAEFVEVVANVASRPVFIVGQAFYDDSNAVRAIAFIDDGFIVVLIAAAGQPS